MSEVNDDAKAGFRRVEVLTGPGRRRRCSSEEKARIVAETLVAGARVSEVARRWQLCPQQVFGWRREARVDVGEQPASPSRSTVKGVLYPGGPAGCCAAKPRG